MDNVESSFKVVLVDLKTTGTDNLEGPLSASYVPSSCIKLILFDHETWTLWPLLFLPRGEKKQKGKRFFLLDSKFGKVTDVRAGAQDWMYRDNGQQNCT